MSRKLDFLTIKRIADRKTETIVKATTNVLALYNERGFKVTRLCVDSEFASPAFISALLRQAITVNAASAREHVAVVERKTCTLKERLRARRSKIPYKKLPKAEPIPYQELPYTNYGSPNFDYRSTI